jgi:hypothetical protein
LDSEDEAEVIEFERHLSRSDPIEGTSTEGDGNPQANNKPQTSSRLTGEFNENIFEIIDADVDATPFGTSGGPRFVCSPFGTSGGPRSVCTPSSPKSSPIIPFLSISRTTIGNPSIDGVT